MSILAMDKRPIYGAAELIQKSRKALLWALGVAACVHMATIGGYWLTVYWMNEEAPVRTVRILKYSELGQPPSLSGLNEAIAPSVSITNPATKPQIGIPVPVPDAEISPEQTFATQDELSQSVDTTGGSGTGVQIESDVKVNNIDDGPPADFVPVNIFPQFIKQVKPVYPDFARRAKIEGTVWVKIWVSKEGKVKDVVVVKTDIDKVFADVFSQAAIEAGKQCLFTPAVAGAGPVAVWVQFPYKFKMQ